MGIRFAENLEYIAKIRKAIFFRQIWKERSIWRPKYGWEDNIRKYRKSV